MPTGDTPSADSAVPCSFVGLREHPYKIRQGRKSEDHGHWIDLKCLNPSGIFLEVFLVSIHCAVTRVCIEPMNKWDEKEPNVAKHVICLGLAILAWHAGDSGYVVQMAPAGETSSRDSRPSDHVVTGTLDQLDFKTGKGLLKTDLGKPIFFDIVRPELLRRLSVGQRVTIEMNEQGQAVKVMEIPPVELPVPPSPAQ